MPALSAFLRKMPVEALREYFDRPEIGLPIEFDWSVPEAELPGPLMRAIPAAAPPVTLLTPVTAPNAAFLFNGCLMGTPSCTVAPVTPTPPVDPAPPVDPTPPADPAPAANPTTTPVVERAITMTRGVITAIGNLPAPRVSAGRAPGDIATGNLNDGSNTLLNIFAQPFPLGRVVLPSSGGNARPDGGAAGAAATVAGSNNQGPAASSEPIVDFMQNFWAWRRSN